MTAPIWATAICMRAKLDRVNHTKEVKEIPLVTKFAGYHNQEYGSKWQLAATHVSHWQQITSASSYWIASKVLLAVRPHCNVKFQVVQQR